MESHGPPQNSRAAGPESERRPLDLRGKVCPDVTVEAVRAAKLLAGGDTLDLISDYYPARQTIPHLMLGLGCKCELLHDGGAEFCFRIHKAI